MRSSQAAVDLIVAEEVSSKELYVKRYQHPEWPGGASGVTVGIGYDCGFSSADRIKQDWGKFVTDDEQLSALCRVAGCTGAEARARLAEVKHVTIPWDAAMAVFKNTDLPKWEAIVLRAVPHSAELSPDCFGVLVSLAYNRGASFSKAGDRYLEMRNIRALIASGEWDKVPGEIRSMKRLWGPSQSGLRSRRDHEADLFEQGLRDHSTIAKETPVPQVTPTGNEQEPDTSKGEKPLNVQPVKAKYDPIVETVQRKLRDMNYHEVGDVDGKWGGKTRGAITAFMNDRGDQPSDGKITPEVLSEIGKAIDEGWTRPIAPNRANATEKDLAPKLPSLNHNWNTKFLAYLAGLPAALAGAFKGMFGDQPSASAYVQPVKDFFGQIPAEYYWFAVAGVALVIVVQATRAENATIKAYQRGEIN